MSFNTHQIYHPLIVNSGWTSQSVSATTISAGTFYGGSLSATYVGNQNVTNQEFRYVSGVTSNAQTQLNNLVNRAESLLTFQSDDFLNNERVFSSGYNLIQTSTSNFIGIEASFKSLEFSSTSVSFDVTQTAITNWSPINFNGDIKSTLIIISGTGSSIISGLSGGSDGRIVIIQNNSSGLIILENDSSKSLLNNKFKFSSEKTHFLVRGKNITLIYKENFGWTNFFNQDLNKNYYLFNDMFSISSNTGTQTAEYGLFKPFAIQKTSGYATFGQSTNFSPSENTFGVLSLSSATPDNVLYPACMIGPSRGLGLSNYTVTVSKIKINSFFDYTGLTAINSAIWFSNQSNYTTGVGSGAALTHGNSSNGSFWVTPITSSTNTNTTNWYLRYGTPPSPTYLVSSVPLSSSTQSWIYFGIYRESTNKIAYFYSYNGNDFFWERFISSSNIAGNGGFFSLGCQTQKASVNPEILCDWVIIDKGF